jgi:hypothetical protein
MAKAGTTRIYQRWSRQLRDQLVRRVNGNYEKIRDVDGFAAHGVIHIVTAEGNSLWVTKDDHGRYYELPKS